MHFKISEFVYDMHVAQKSKRSSTEIDLNVSVTDLNVHVGEHFLKANLERSQRV